MRVGQTGQNQVVTFAKQPIERNEELLRLTSRRIGFSFWLGNYISSN